MKAAYLFSGTDQAKLDRARSRLRNRALAEGGDEALELFDPIEGRGSPDAEALAMSLTSLSLIPGRRHLLADGIEKWGRKQAEAVAAAIGDAVEDTTVVLIARGKVPAGIAAAVKKAGGASFEYQAPRGTELVSHLVAGARQRGFSLDADAARTLIARLGERPVRLETELDRLALWAGPDGEVTAEDLDSMIHDETEPGRFDLGDALVAGDRGRALAAADRLVAAGERPGGLVYTAAASVRRAHRALSLIESGMAPARVERELGISPFVARRVIASVGNGSVEQLRAAATALSDLELWLRGGSSYPEELALDLTLIRAT